MSDEPVEPGSYLIDVFDVPIEVTVPPGWTVFDEFVLHGPGGATLLFVTTAFDVYTDACQLDRCRGPVGPTVEDLVSALIAQEPTVSTEPREVNVGGYKGTELKLSSPPGGDYSKCYGGSFVAMIDDLGRQYYLEVPGEAQTLWILDLDGVRALISFWAPSAAPDVTRAELDAMVAGLKFG
jgi:hypothetical protein